MFCSKCGTELIETAMFCSKCGLKVDKNHQKEDYVDIALHCKFCGSVVDSSSEICKFCGNAPFTVPSYGESDPKLAVSSTLEDDSSDEHESSKFKNWWDNSSKVKKVLIVAVALLIVILVVRFLVLFLREFGGLLFGILLIASLILGMFTGSKEERIETRKTLLKLIIGGAFIFIISLVIVLKSDSLFDIIQPGASVRNAYLSQYSDDITIEEAFDNYFENPKWSKYEEAGYTYVVFSGVCEYLGDRADAKITFKITGENFVVDSLDLNGRTQNDLMLYALLRSIYSEEE